MEFYLIEKFMEKFLLLSYHDTEQRFSYEEFRQGSCGRDKGIPKG
jgi:hypothetical protein